MNSSSHYPESDSVIELQSEHRWSIYLRLQELEIPCWCRAHRPLRVQLDHVNAVIQYWQVFRQFSSPQHELVEWLETCWHQPCEFQVDDR